MMNECQREGGGQLPWISLVSLCPPHLSLSSFPTLCCVSPCTGGTGREKAEHAVQATNTENRVRARVEGGAMMMSRPASQGEGGQ